MHLRLAALMMMLALSLPAVVRGQKYMPTWPSGKTVIDGPSLKIARPGVTVSLHFYTPAELDVMLPVKPDDYIAPDDPDSLAKYIVQKINIERAELKEDKEILYRRPVMVLLLIAMTATDNDQPFVLHSDYEVGIQRGQQEIRDLGWRPMLWVGPGDISSIWLVFPAIEFQPADRFYINIPDS